MDFAIQSIKNYEGPHLDFDSILKICWKDPNRFLFRFHVLMTRIASLQYSNVKYRGTWA